jgi:hypothetical protein
VSERGDDGEADGAASAAALVSGDTTAETDDGAVFSATVALSAGAAGSSVGIDAP